MFSLKKKSLTRVICTALTFMSALPFGVAHAGTGNTVTVTDRPDNPRIYIDKSLKMGIGIDMGVTGWCGKQRGISFNMGFNWAF